MKLWKEAITGGRDLGSSYIEVSRRYNPGWTTKGKALEREEKEAKDKSYSHFITPTHKDHHFYFYGF